jgi:hypothetical protein
VVRQIGSALHSDAEVHGDQLIKTVAGLNMAQAGEWGVGFAR